MNAYSVNIVSDTATPALRQLAAGYTPARLAARIGPPLQKLTMQHLAGLGPNAKGYPSTRFYEKFARNVRWLPAPYGVDIAILPAVINGRTVGLGLRVFGGTITAQTVDFLSIPINPVSYGHVPSDFPGLFCLKLPTGAYLVQRGEVEGPGLKTRRIGKGAGQGGNVGRRLRASLLFLFKLVRSVDQAGNREVLPSEEAYQSTAILWLQPGSNN